MYETHEESSKIGNTTIDSHFANVESEEVIGQSQVMTIACLINMVLLMKTLNSMTKKS